LGRVVLGCCYSVAILFFASQSVAAEKSSCIAVVYKDIVDNPRIPGFQIDFKNDVDWSYSNLPLTALNGKCKVGGASPHQFLENGGTMILRPEGVEPGYFFYVSDCGDQNFCISWNGHKDVRHAQWLITEHAQFSASETQHCYADHRVKVCVSI